MAYVSIVSDLVSTGLRLSHCLLTHTHNPNPASTRGSSELVVTTVTAARHRSSSAQSEKGEAPAGAGEDAKTDTPAFEACLKIRGLGVDTAGTLNAFGGVLCAASKSREGRAPADEMRSTPKSSWSLESPGIADSVDRAVGLDEIEPDCVSESAAVFAPCDDEDSAQQAVPASASSPPALWSLEFAYSELERILEALETAVSGLVFVVCAAANHDAEPEALALW